MMRRYKIFQNNNGQYKVVKYIWYVLILDKSPLMTLEGALWWIDCEEETYRSKQWSKVQDHPAEFYQTAARLRAKP